MAPRVLDSRLSQRVSLWIHPAAYRGADGPQRSSLESDVTECPLSGKLRGLFEWPEVGRDRSVVRGFATAGVTVGLPLDPTSTSTESRPVEDRRVSNGGDSVEFPASGRTITSSIWRRIPMATAGLAGVGALQSRGVTGGGEGVVEATPRVPAGSQTVRGVQTGGPAYFWRKIQRVIGADVYRNSTVDRGLG